jgi:hypothetical protein
MAKGDDLRTHEEVCAERYINLCDRLDRGSQRMTRIETLLIGIFPWTIGLIFAAKWF